jgi:hypothetical protein
VKNWTKVVMDRSTRQDLVQNQKKMEGCRKKKEEEESYFMYVFNNIGILQIKSTLSKIFVGKLIWVKVISVPAETVTVSPYLLTSYMFNVSDTFLEINDFTPQSLESFC